MVTEKLVLYFFVTYYDPEALKMRLTRRCGFESCRGHRATLLKMHMTKSHVIFIFKVAHKISVSKFANSANIVVEINNIDNLIGLCPNHHWEYDHGFLDLADM